MPISFDRYVRITSGVGAATNVSRRELIGRFFTSNVLVPTGMALEFADADAVSEFFGSEAEETARANFYFGFISKNISSPQNLSFSRWVMAASAPQLYGAMPASLTTLQSISAGSFTLEMGGVSLDVTSLDLSSAGSLEDVASTVQAAIRLGSGTQFTAATVMYVSTRQQFVLTGGETGPATISVTAGSTNDASGPLGWAAGSLESPGADTQTITETLSTSASISNNFGSFAFVDTLTTDQITEASTWNSTQNVLYQYQVQVNPSNAAAISEAVIGFAGTGLTLNLPTLTDQYPEVLPMAVLAATDYSRRAATQNYMFQQSASLTPTVLNDTGANTYDPLRVNYYGQTQQAGNVINFYQRGVLCGGSTAPVDMNTFANEQWFKDAAGAEIMNLLTTLPRVPANDSGRGQLIAVVQTVIDQALLNGTISVGRDFTTQQQLFIGQQTGDPLAWQQVQTSGYWINGTIVMQTGPNNLPEFCANYLLIYAKDDAIRCVTGTHTLI